MNQIKLERLRRLLCDLQWHLCQTLITTRRRRAHDFAKIAGVTAADTI